LGATQGAKNGSGWKACGVDINPDNVAVCTAKGLDVRLRDLSVNVLPFDNDGLQAFL